MLAAKEQKRELTKAMPFDALFYVRPGLCKKSDFEFWVILRA